MNTCTHSDYEEAHVVKCECPLRSRRTWSQQRVPHDAMVLRPSTLGVVRWMEVVDTTDEVATHRTYARGDNWVRLVVPIPEWLASILTMADRRKGWW